jgi:glycine cleavage system aminomethyltransferase T
MLDASQTPRPQRLSPLYHKQAALGARFVQDPFGWVRAERFTDSTDERTERAISICDISHLTKLSLKSNNIAQAVSGLFNRSVTQGTVLQDGPGAFKEALCALVSDDEAMLIVGPTASQSVTAELSADTHKSFRTVDITSVLGGVYLIGARSREVLSKLTELNVNPEDFPNLTAAPAPLRHVQCLVLRIDLAGLVGYHIYFERAYGEYMWDSIFHAGREFEMAPIGSSTMEHLGWRLG